MARPRTSWFLAAGLAAALRQPSGMGGEEAEQAISPPPEVRLGARSRVGQAPGPLDWVLEKVASGTDQWESEKVHEELARELERLAARIEALDLREESLAGLLAPGFRGGPPLPGALEPVHAGPAGLEIVRSHRKAAGAELPAAPFAAALRDLFADFSRVEKAKFKVFQVQAGPGADAVSCRALLEADGASRSAGFIQVRAVWDFEWVRAGESWAARAIQPLTLERATVRRRPFVEVSERALGGNSSYRDQLLIGLDGWRTRIDSASGMDIYGHQGVAVGDFDGDGWEDFYVAQPAGLPNRLYRNRGDGTFDDVTSSAGVGVLDTTGGSLFIDLDNDGDLDLTVVTSFEVLLFENGGDGKFQRREATGLERTGEKRASSMGCAAADHDRDGDLDLYIYCYIFWAGAGSKTHSSYPYPYHDANNGAPNFLFRNEGGFKFTNVTESSGMDANNHRFSLAASWGDYDGDGDPDLYVANDFGKNNLYRNRGDGTFEDVAAEAGVEDTGNGMSVSWEDYDNDGKLDLYVGNMWSSAGARLASQPGFGRVGPDLQALYRRMARGNSLFRNLGDGRFEDLSIASGAFFGRWAWSCQFIDYDADGREDLYIANGFVSNERQDDL